MKPYRPLILGLCLLVASSNDVLAATPPASSLPRATPAAPTPNVARIMSVRLIDRGNGMIYDSDVDITWLADANYAKTTGYSADGRMTWRQAMDWVRTLVVGGHSGWRLPTSVNHDGTHPVYGLWRAGSEMGHLFYTELGPWPRNYPNPLVKSMSPSLALFTHIPLNPDVNLQVLAGDVSYWTSSDETATPYYAGPQGAWTFLIGAFIPGMQTLAPKDGLNFAWAVHDGDVANQPEKSSERLKFAEKAPR